ncbi:type III restriction enzyme, res subunit [Hirsutella rhossiliensis]|uniref:Type III restriction enzyme, res subunit domain-containing protein n=1 Tax=Hirsutella rhossiliensis TaxID=111463 RepID=A0A9P8MUY3_9HYPO|nr:type III restriction enzyme, res subunit domain-containing protein [Hirsutella rhossiliensis]KAH0959667.1 type III restriction enzyme, res subunit domain-containing protein [Hirsutella rhossiliensis]
MVSSDDIPVIEVLDDQDTLSETEHALGGGGKSDPRKRKVQEQLEEKVQWTDESDGGPAKPKKKKAKRKSKKTSKVHGDEVKGNDDELDLGGIPDYLQERRRAFDADKKLHHEAALMLPPDYTDIIFDEPGTLGEVKERPEFSAFSGIKPSRPYEDIELPQSAGLIPASIAQYLRDYQVAGVKFLHRKFVYQEGGILGDDMGLGKTVQVAAFLTVAFGKKGDERDAKRMREVRFCGGRWYPRVLIVCPGSLIMNWKNEMNRWGWWHIDVFHGTNKDDVLGTARSGLLEIMITTYDTYKNNRSSINMVQWDVVVADECHRLKDRYSETTKAMAEINALCRIGLTGTAIQNKYEELWTLLDWTNPGHFGTRAEWTQSIAKPLTVGQSHEATFAQLSLARQTAKKLVQNLLPRYFLRRMKTLIADQLPKKTDRVVFCPLTDLQREAYENFLDSAGLLLLRTISDTCPHGNKKGWCCATHLPDGTSWQRIVFPSIIVLQKLANHLTLLVPSTTDLEPKHKSELRTLQTCMPDTWKKLYEQRDQIRNLVDPEFCGKWKILRKLLKFWRNGGDKVLVFSHSVRLLRILQHLFTNTSYNVSYLDGSLSYEQRQETVDTFNSDPRQFVFLISTKAGGVGLNITSANKVVIVDPHWNPSYDLQAQDRAYRIGQTRDVEVFRLISLGTVEEVVYARQIYKQQQANIGYTASSERRYFRGVQQNAERKGEIFGLSNIFTYHKDIGLLRDIVNKTNVAEAKAGVHLADVDMEKAAQEDEQLGVAKKEEADEDGGLNRLATLLTAEDQEKMLESQRVTTPKTDAIQAILTSVGVEYTHDNSEVIGSSKVEEQLSRRAAMASYADADMEGQSALFADSEDEDNGQAPHRLYRPPEDICLRQFCEMARTLGFASATEFALVVESWPQETRRRCLDTFYKKREEALAAADEDGELHASPQVKKAEDSEHEHVEDKDIKLEDTKAGMVKAEKVKGEGIQLEDAKVRGVKLEEVKSEDTKARIVKAKEVKSEGAKLEDTNYRGMKAEEVKSEMPSVQPSARPDMDDDKAKVMLEGTTKRTSIFLVDDDDDDDEL